MKKQIAYKVRDCKEGERAELTLEVDTLYFQKYGMVCSGCKRLKCTPSCKAEDYVQKMMYSFEALDCTGFINLRITYWSNVDGSKIQLHHKYKVTGEIRRKYNNKFDLIAEKMEEVKKVAMHNSFQ